MLRRPAPDSQHSTVSNAACARVARGVTCFVAARLRMCDTCRSAKPAARQTPIGSECGSPSDLMCQSTSPHHAAPPQSSLVAVPEWIACRLAVLVYGCLHGMAPAYRCQPMPICSASPRSARGNDFALRRPRHLLAVARNFLQSATVTFLLPHQLFGTGLKKPGFYWALLGFRFCWVLRFFEYDY